MKNASGNRPWKFKLLPVSHLSLSYKVLENKGPNVMLCIPEHLACTAQAGLQSMQAANQLKNKLMTLM